MKKSIGVINLNHSFNYGAVIQAKVLCSVLSSFGEPWIIDYRPNYSKDRRKVFNNPFSHAARCYIKKEGALYWKELAAIKGFFGCLIKNFLYFRKRKWLKYTFSAYREKEFKLTKEYNTVEELFHDPPKMDAYVCGSDQIWTFEVTDNKPDLAFFLKFGDNTVRRVAYAASASRDMLKLSDSEVAGLLEGFNGISLRESLIMDDLILKSGNKQICKVLDPTLLIDEKTYREFEEPVRVDGKYIFCYIASSIRQKGLAHTVSSVARMTGLPVKYININEFGNKEFKSFDEVCGATPGQFLSLIKNAEIVVTDSFHALTISMIYHKKIVCIMGTNKRQDRITETTQLFGLSDRCVMRGCEAPEISMTPIDYSVFDSKIDDLRKRSLEFLKKALYD